MGAGTMLLAVVASIAACGRLGYAPADAAAPADSGPSMDASDAAPDAPVDAGEDVLPSDGSHPDVVVTDIGTADTGGCLGCMAGGECLTGTEPSACGRGGEPCATCAGAEVCLENRCQATGPRALLGLGFGWSCAALEGRAWCWGSNFTGELGDGTTVDRSTPRPVVDLAMVAELAASDTATCALRMDGTVACWGSPVYGASWVPIAGIDDAVALSGGETHFCALRVGGAVACWGDNYDGRLGDGTTTRSAVPVAVGGLATAQQVTAGFSHSCARVAGEVFCWGENMSGQLGDGTTTGSLSPVRVTGLADAVDVAAGYRHTCAARASGGVVCWGGGFAAPVLVPGSDGIGRLRAGYEYTCGVREAVGVAVCWGLNGVGQLGDGTTTDRASAEPVSTVTGVLEVETGNQHACARTSVGQIWCWGDNASGELGDGSIISSPTPVRVVFP